MSISSSSFVPAIRIAFGVICGMALGLLLIAATTLA